MEIEKIIIDSLNECKKTIIQNIDSQNIKASGRTQKGLKVEKRGSSIVLTSGGGAPFRTLQYGREGGKVPYDMIGIITQWMKDKGITPTPIPYKTDRKHKYSPLERGYMQRAYFISKKIKEIGTERYKQPNEQVYSDAIAQCVDSIGKNIILQLKIDINQNI